MFVTGGISKYGLWASVAYNLCQFVLTLLLPVHPPLSTPLSKVPEDFRKTEDVVTSGSGKGEGVLV